VMTGLAVVEELRASGQRLPFALEILAFADEEGVRFPSSLTGSMAAAGKFVPALLDERDEAGMTRREALVGFGVSPDTIAAEARDPAQTIGYLEVHIEQGPLLESRNLPLGIVTAIQGNTRARLTVTGTAGHAGTLPFSMRQDALTAAAEMVLEAERVARDSDDFLATIGDLDVPGGAINVVPGKVVFTLDTRSTDDAHRRAATQKLLARFKDVAERRGTRVDIAFGHDAPAAPCDLGLQQSLAEAATAEGLEPFRLASGAGHDAMSFGGVIPHAMLFVRCAGGISHNPAEHASVEDIGLAARVLRRTVLNLAEQHAAPAQEQP